MDKNNAVGVLEKLVETCRDGEKGYRDAAEHVKRSDLKTYFQEQSRERAQFAQELESELARVGNDSKKESGSVSAAMHRAWIDIKISLGGGDQTILQSVEQGEDAAKEAYAEALGSSLPQESEGIVRRQAERVRSAHDKVRLLRDSLAA
jgi:uncharacterized protein (TIGR02284 family)